MSQITLIDFSNLHDTEWSAKRPELRRRVGRKWTTEHYQNHRRDRALKFIKEETKILEHVIAQGKHSHLVLAGDPRTVSQVLAGLPKHLKEKLVDIVSVPDKTSTDDVVSVTLSAFAEHEQRESIEVVGHLDGSVCCR